MINHVQAVAERRKSLGDGRSSEEDDGQMGARFGCTRTRLWLLYERGEWPPRMLLFPYTYRVDLTNVMHYSPILARSIGKSRFMASITKDSTRSKISMTLIIYSMGTLP